jgi:phage-related protein
MAKYTVFYLDAVTAEIEALPPPVQARIKAAEEALSLGEFQSLYIKTLKGPIRELIVGDHRLVYFPWKERHLLFVDIFRKKSKKTPLQVLRRAERIYKKIKQQKK